MRYKAEQKQEIRKNMVDAAARAFRRNGYSGVGVDGLATEAGVTSGAIYSQFGSKEGAFIAALGGGMDLFIEAVPAFQRQHGERWLAEFIDFYLGAEHVADIAGGCTIGSLVPDVVRADSTSVRQVFETKARTIVDLMAQGLAGPLATRQQRAWASLAALIGALNLARSMPKSEAADTIIAAVKKSALDAAGPISSGAGE